MGMELLAGCAPAQSPPVTGSPSTAGAAPLALSVSLWGGGCGHQSALVPPLCTNQWHWTMVAVQQGQRLPCSSLVLSPCGANSPAA